MKRKYVITVVALILISLSIWLINSDYEFGKYDSFDEAIEKGIPYEVKEIITIRKYDGVRVVFYTTVPDKKDYPFANYDSLAVAFFEGNDKNGWKNIGQNGWEHYENDNLTSYSQGVYVEDDQENVKHDFRVLFGEINNPEIEKVQTKTEVAQGYRDAKIVTHNGLRYYYQFGEDTIVRGLSTNGDVIDQ